MDNNTNTTLYTGGRLTRAFYQLLFFAAAIVLISVAHVPKAEAARCTVASNGDTSCTHNTRYNQYWCNGVPVARKVRWQVPEGTPPAGGWPVAFLYQGTNFNDSNHPFSRKAGDSFGTIYETRMIREMLDNPSGTGQKYAVLVPEPPNSTVLVEFWHTNVVTPYSVSCDQDFFDDFFAEIKSGSYGSQLNMNKRYAFGISSGGYNTSRMAVSFNSGTANSNTFKALAVISASYATCKGAICSVPSLPANHPPTRFYHGTADLIVPISTMRKYYDQLGIQSLERSKIEHGSGHTYTSHNVGSTGVKAWFDAHP
ncbi:MAG TPA: hypothetical protein PLW86_09335 [Rhodocyclaceae bacterium]|nr:hypothetical protein [Rhodocyclaceae bacterium]